MILTFGSTVVETSETFLIQAGPHEQWHSCSYPERPGVMRVRPGSSCPGGCEAFPVATRAATPAPAPVTDADVKAAGEPPPELVEATEAAVADEETAVEHAVDHHAVKPRKHKR